MMRTRVALGVVVGMLVLAAAGCGGSAKTSSTTTTTGTATSRAVAFARCMRSHGLPGWPDPNSKGVFDKTKLSAQHLGASASEIQGAQQACRHLLPTASAAQQRAGVAQALRFSECVRTHGVPSFPEPDSTGRIPDPATVGVDQGSRAFEAANQACAKYRPPYMPSNAAYNAWAATHSG